MRPLLVIGNKNYSSWSLRPWLALRASGIAFDEVQLPLFTDEFRRRIAEFSPAGRVPVLVDGDVRVWESIAILEYAAERWPDRGLWPASSAARAHARTVCAEMHAGFHALRAAMPMNLRSFHPGKGRSPEVDADIARVSDLWRDCLARSGGPFLFGAFGNADAMYAPVVTRFVTYGVALAPDLQRYSAAVLGLPAMREWHAAGCAETAFLAEDEPYAQAP
jgi:glutathione S-transferase